MDFKYLHFNRHFKLKSSVLLFSQKKESVLENKLEKRVLKSGFLPPDFEPNQYRRFLEYGTAGPMPSQKDVDAKERGIAGEEEDEQRRR